MSDHRFSEIRIRPFGVSLRWLICRLLDNLRLRNLQEIVQVDLQQLIKSLLNSIAIFCCSNLNLAIFCIDSVDFLYPADRFLSFFFDMNLVFFAQMLSKVDQFLNAFCHEASFSMLTELLVT